MKNKFLLFLLVSLLIPSNFIDRFRVPVYATTSVGVGYDSNIFKFSESDINDVHDNFSFLGDSEKFDSGMIKSGLEIEYSPDLWHNHEIRFLSSILFDPKSLTNMKIEQFEKYFLKRINKQKLLKNEISNFLKKNNLIYCKLFNELKI